MGALIAGLSAFMRYTPHAIFGPGEEALSYDTSVTGLNKSKPEERYSYYTRAELQIAIRVMRKNIHILR